MVSFAIKRPITILMVTTGLCLLGAISWQRLAVQLLPEFIFPEVNISTGLPGASPEKIERDLVIPIEAELATLENVHDIESRVFSEFANITVSFEYGTDMKFALLKLEQKMNTLQKNLPAGSGVEVNRFDTADLATFVMQLSIRGDAPLEDLREAAERTVRQRLEQIDGVVNIQVGGGDRRTVGIQVDPDLCTARGIPIAMVQQKINAYHRQSEHLGRVLSRNARLDVIMIGQIDDLQELAELLIEPSRQVRLKDVATIGYGHEERTQYFRVNGKAGVGIFVQKDNISNILHVANAVLAELEELNADLAPSGYEVVVNFSQAELIQRAIDRIERLAITGAILAVLVLYLFLRNIRFVAILMVAIPVSLLVTFNFMYGFNLSINILSLCGLALAIGMLVDNGIVVMENIFLHRQSGKPAREAALIGTREVGRSIFAATGTTVLVFLPVLFVESEAKLLVRELALSVIFPLLVSLVVALTLIPLLSSRALTGSRMRPFRSGRVLEIYRLLLKAAMRHRIRTISIVAVFLLISLFVGLTFIISQAPPPPPARLDLYVTMPRGSTLDATDTIVRRLEEQAQALTDMKEIRTNVRAEEAHLSINFLEPDKRTETLQLEKIKKRIEDQNERIEHVDLSFERPRLSGGGRSSGGDGMGSLLTQDKGLRLKGHDITTLRLLSDHITESLSSIQDIDRRSVQSDLGGGAPELQIRGDRLRLAFAGLDMQRVMQAIWTTRADATRASTPFGWGQSEIDISLELANSRERELKDIQQVRIQNDSGQFIPLSQVADIRIDQGPGNIVRLNQERQVEITYKFVEEAQTSKSRLELIENQVDRLMQELRLPRGFTLERTQSENKQRVYYWMLAIGALLIYMFLAAQFESFSTPIIILGTVPTAIIGALFALALTGTPLTLGQSAPMALLGLIVLLGIVVNNGIILLDRIAILRKDHGYRWQRAVMIAGQSRVRPIVMTSATTILGLFPLSLKQGTEFELWPPFAITVLGGLAVSSISTLVFVPVLYVGLEQLKAWLNKIGPAGVAFATLVTAATVYWFYGSYQSILYTALAILPLWFGCLGLIYGGKHYLLVRREKRRLEDEDLEIEILSLTKIYGTPGRFMREWHKRTRRWSRVAAQDGVPWEKQELKETAVWMVTLGAVLAYLHFFLSSGFWLTIVSLLTLVWLFAAREFWYRWRFVSGKPPSLRRKRGFRLFRRRKDADTATENSELRALDPLHFSRRGGALLALVFLAYLQLRVATLGLTVTAAILALILANFQRISRKIARGEIDPELPRGRLRKVKRGFYTVTRNLPFIRPPKPQVVALQNVNLKIGRGMFGLLGPNGAGKTTLMRILVGVLDQDRGTIKINNRNLAEHRDTFHGSIGYLPQDFGLYENMTPLEYLHYHALTNGIYEPESRGELIDNIIKSVGLWDRRDDKVKTFSGGMKQRVGIAQTLLHLPQIIVVDEPTAGLDPRERIRFRNLLSDLAKERIVVFSTHIVEDISSTCQDLAVLDKGQVIYRGSPEEMQRRAEGKVFEAVIPEKSFSEWQAKLRVVQHSKTDNGIRIRFLAEEPASELQCRGVEPSLEDAYVYLLKGKNRGQYKI